MQVAPARCYAGSDALPASAALGGVEGDVAGAIATLRRACRRVATDDADLAALEARLLAVELRTAPQAGVPPMPITEEDLARGAVNGGDDEDASGDDLLQVWMPAPHQAFVVVNPRRIVTRALLGEKAGDYHDVYNASKAPFVMFVAGWVAVALEFFMWCGVLPFSPALQTIATLIMVWCVLHCIGRLNVITLRMAARTFDFWLPMTLLVWFCVALLDVLGWNPGQVVFILMFALYCMTGVASDAFAFRRSKLLVLLHLFTGVSAFTVFCVLAHFRQFRAVDTDLTRDVGGLQVKMLETASSRSLGALCLWLRLMVVVWRRPHEAGVLKCPMERTLMSRRALAAFRARGQPLLVYPEGLVIDAAGFYKPKT